MNVYCFFSSFFYQPRLVLYRKSFFTFIGHRVFFPSAFLGLLYIQIGMIFFWTNSLGMQKNHLGNLVRKNKSSKNENQFQNMRYVSSSFFVSTCTTLWIIIIIIITIHSNFICWILIWTPIVFSILSLFHCLSRISFLPDHITNYMDSVWFVFVFVSVCATHCIYSAKWPANLWNSKTFGVHAMARRSELKGIRKLVHHA